jgi:4-amino-4-deoxy-L-arabinose transferase-like glycosyltransferase
MGLSIGMFTTHDPDLLVGEIALAGLGLALFWRFLAWVRDAPVKPDPWDAETEQKASSPETPAACHRCSIPLKPDAWFCPHCNTAVGPYNNLMPYVQIFSEGEVLRNGSSPHLRNRPLIVIGYFLLTLVFCPFLAPLYWILLAKNLRKRRN